MEENKLKPFDLEKAKAGAKVVTRDGRNVRIICWDRMGKNYPIIALVEESNVGEEVIETFTDRGTLVGDEGKDDLDLFMAPTTVEQWVNVYKDENGVYFYAFHKSEKKALQYKDGKDYITTIKISWEE